MTDSRLPNPLAENGLLSWDYAKRSYFYEDGMHRDIVVLGTDERDWVVLVDWVVEADVPYRYHPFNETDDPSLQNATLFDAGRPVEFVLHPETLCVRALPYLTGPERVELDIRPEWIRSSREFHEFLGFLREMARAIGRPVEVRPENQEPALFIVDRDGRCHHVRGQKPDDPLPNGEV